MLHPLFTPPHPSVPPLTVRPGRTRCRPHARQRALTRTQLALLSGSCILLACSIVFAVATIHWPLAGDASLMHYIDFLMDHGRVPYRDIDDMNLPGSYLIDYAVMHLLGGGSLPWRLFDLGLVITGILAMLVVARPYGWHPGIWAGTLLMLVHGQDGIFELGQRDLVVAVLMLIAYAAFFHAARVNTPHAMLLFGGCSGMMATIKPLFLPFGIALLLLMTLSRKKRHQSLAPFVSWGIFGLLLPLMAVAGFLWSKHAFREFLSVMTGILPLHAALARKPLGFLLLHACSPLLPLIGLWLLSWPFCWRRWVNIEGAALFLGLMFGLVSYVVQGKGFSYHRYPFIALLLLIVSIDLHRCISASGWSRVIGWGGIGLGTLILAPLSTVKASQYDWRNTEFSTMLQSDLKRLGGNDLSEHVQCIDTIGGCFNALYELRLLQSDRFVYDEFLFANAKNSSVESTRKRFFEELRRNPPHFIVLTDDLFPTGPNNYRKVELWPLFAAYLQTHYFRCAEATPPDVVRWWSREQRPHSYRILCHL